MFDYNAPPVAQTVPGNDRPGREAAHTDRPASAQTTPATTRSFRP